MAEDRQRVSQRTRPDLGWTGREKGTYIVEELIQSDAFRTLNKTETDLILFVWQRRQYKKRRNKKDPVYNTWEPVNGNSMTIPHVAVVDFYSKGDAPPPVGSTITRALNKLMAHGFLEPVSIGGHGKGDMTIYRLAHDWRLWRKGDPPVYTKAGMAKAKGFCIPGATTFCPVQKQKRGAKSHDFLHANSHEKDGENSSYYCEPA